MHLRNFCGSQRHQETSNAKEEESWGYQEQYLKLLHSQLRPGHGRKTAIETLDDDNQGMWALRAGLFYLRT